MPATATLLPVAASASGSLREEKGLSDDNFLNLSSNSYHCLNAYYVPGPVLSTLYTWSPGFPTTIL